ncbi:hypothetical protein TSUD_351120 [Trifolium subterraneum]|uniref:Uncharacterized protein n=1 Tax=Trifolium subterraneum TaxID=3900 RepID=A0A2Z6P734_TRISU|nr:hypothetical protein TSUD_351120 [Trifolium subterraneum]
MSNIDRDHTLKGIVVLMHKSVLNHDVVDDIAEGDIVPPSFLDNSIALKLISASKADDGWRRSSDNPVVVGSGVQLTSRRQQNFGQPPSTTTTIIYNKY